MIFLHKYWSDFCRRLKDENRISVCACDVLKGNSEDRYIVLKHDVETDVKKAYRMAQIEHEFGHRGSYYVQAYLLDNTDNIALLQAMQEMGHEISYHYDVMDSSKGDLPLAIRQYQENVKRFEDNGFRIETVCQHGNPVVERVGYTSNRDFFRSEEVQQLYPSVADIMVDFKRKANTDYTYFSDAGRHFQLIFDPIDNDIENSDDKNIVFDDLNAVFDHIKDQTVIISTHPHRWEASGAKYCVRTALFKTVRAAAKTAMKIPALKKLMSRYYYLAKKM